MATATAPGQRPARAKGGRPRSDRNDATAKVDASLLTKAKLVADARRISVAEYLSELIRAPLDRDFAREVKRLAGEVD